jgi:hypothetical protein
MRTRRRSRGGVDDERGHSGERRLARHDPQRRERACLEVPGSTSEVTNIRQAPCTGAANQQWIRTARGGAWEIRSALTDLCLDIPSSGRDDHLIVQHSTRRGTGPAGWRAYVHVLPTHLTRSYPGGIDLQYWFFYPFNDSFAQGRRRILRNPARDQ